MDAARHTISTRTKRPFRAGVILFGLVLSVVFGGAVAEAQTTVNGRPITPPNDQQSAVQPHEPTDGRSIGTTVAALGAILLLFLGLVQVWRRLTPQASQTLPDTAWEILGSAPLDNKHQLMVVRLGRRLLVLGRSDEGLQTLSEITSGDEVSQLISLCQSPEQPTEKNSFRLLYENFRSQIGASQRADAASSSPDGESRRA